MNRKFHNGVAALGAEHDRVFANLPWLVNETLADEEQLEATSHISCCLVCRRELVALNALRETVASRTAEPRCEAALDRLHERINERACVRRIVPWAAAAVLVLVLGLTGVVAFNAGVMSSSHNKAALAPGAASVNKVVDDATADLPVMMPDDDPPQVPFEQSLVAHDAGNRNAETRIRNNRLAVPPARGNHKFVPLWHIRKTGLHSSAPNSSEAQVIFFEPVLSRDAPAKKD